MFMELTYQLGKYISLVETYEDLFGRDIEESEEINDKIREGNLK